MNDTQPNNDNNQPPPVPPQQPQGHVEGDVWGVRPPALDQQPTGYPRDTTYNQQGYSAYGSGSRPDSEGSSRIDRSLSALQKSPLRRDTENGIVGGVAAGIAKRMGVSTAAVRIATILLALFFGSGIAAYIIAWALLPDESGKTHAEQGVKGGNTKSLILLAVGAIAALGILGSILDGLGWLIPVAVVVGLVGYVVYAGKDKDKGKN